MRCFTFVVSLVLGVAWTAVADAPSIRISIRAQGDHGDDARMVSALSREFRKLDGVAVTDEAPVLKVTCVVIPLSVNRGVRTGFASSTAVTSADDRLITHLVQTHSSIEALAHEIATQLDGAVVEELRRVSPSPSPQ